MQEDFLKMLQLQEEKISEAKDRIQKLTKPPCSRMSDPVRSLSPLIPSRKGMKNLSLKELRQILRSHYCEKSATEAYQELTNVVQEPNETALNFLMRALKLRQHILLASEEKESKIRYDTTLVQNVFINAVETGLVDDAIRTRIRPFLEMSRVSDEVLIREINIAMTTESERSNKFGARKRPAKNNQASVLATEVADKQTTKETNAKQQADTAKIIGAIVGAVAFIVFVVTIVLWCHRRRRTRNSEDAEGTPAENIQLNA
eukprot:gene10477-11576_t